MRVRGKQRRQVPERIARKINKALMNNHFNVQSQITVRKFIKIDNELLLFSIMFLLETDENNKNLITFFLSFSNISLDYMSVLCV